MSPTAILDLHGSGDTVMPYYGQYFNNSKARSEYNTTGYFWGQSQGFPTTQVYTANIPSYYSHWAGTVNNIKQTSQVVPFTSSTTQEEEALLYVWASPGRATVQHIQVVGGEHCWFGHPTAPLGCSTATNLQIDTTIIFSQYTHIPLTRDYVSPSPPTTSTPALPFTSNPSGIIDLSYQSLVAPGTSMANITATLFLSSTTYYSTRSSSWTMGFFEVVNFNGDVVDPDDTNEILSPSDPRWIEAILNPNHLVVVLPTTTLMEPNQQVHFTLPGGKIYASFVMTRNNRTCSSQQHHHSAGDISTPFRRKDRRRRRRNNKLMVIDLPGGSSFGYQKVSSNGQTRGQRMIFHLQGITLM